MRENKIIKFFNEIKENEAITVTIVPGENSLEATYEEVTSLCEKEKSIIEIKVPFSDPSIDSEFIKKAELQALKNGISLKNIIDLVEKLRVKIENPIILNTYLNPVISVGIDNFFNRIEKIGVDGVVIPEIPLEEYNIIKSSSEKTSLIYIPLINVNGSEDRIEKLSEIGKGFVYIPDCLSDLGNKNKIKNNI